MIEGGEFLTGAVRNVVGIGGAISSGLKLSDQAARSIG
jgi:glycerol-3-phosphate dehydrogenase